MVSGGFDPLHPGHVEYFAAASQLGLPLLCNVSTDADVERKHAPLLTQEERARVIDAIRFVDYTHVASGTTEEVLRLLRPRLFVKGVDWQGRLPDGEARTCAELGIEICYLDTVVSSSSGVLERFLEQQAGRPIGRLEPQIT
jgi:cytidyltransferase-like protein